MEQILKAIQEMSKNINDRFDLLERQVSEGFRDVNARLDKAEGNTNEDIIAILKQIESNTKGLSYDIDYLAEKVGKHELELNRLNRN
ncbi:hypothetical protein [Peribacillus frigoritolerans]|uniref:hypothetical protein n=1 Tax=Peribacillus frigoritolerans TaxID=450367 RepID=UPI003F7DE7CE